MVSNELHETTLNNGFASIKVEVCGAHLLDSMKSKRYPLKIIIKSIALKNHSQINAM